MNQVKVINVNVNGLRSREAELDRFILDQGKNCIFAISDTRLSQNSSIRNIEGYTLLRSDKKLTGVMATAGGVGLLIPEKWSCQRVSFNFRSDEIEYIAAIIFPPDQNCQPLKIVSVYNHPGNYFPAELLTEFKKMSLNGNAIPGLIVGDFNCPHLAFGSRSSNDYGNKLLQSLNTENLVFFNDGTSTYCSNSSGLSNVLDLVIGEPHTSPLIESCTVRGDIGSDHFPVITTFKCKMNPASQRKVNLRLWVSNVDRELEHMTFTSDLENNVNEINRIFKDSHERSCFTPTRKKQPLPTDIMTNIRLRKFLLKSRQKAQSEMSRMLLNKRYNQVNKKVKQQIQDYNDQQVEDLADSICNADCTSKMWKLFNKFKSECKDIAEPATPLLTPSGEFTTNDKSRCDEFARYLRSVHQTPESPFFDSDFKKEVERSVDEIEMGVDGNSIPPISVQQLDDLLMEVKAGSAPGNDLITYDLLKKCSNNSKKVICCLLNQCLAENKFPSEWKSAKVTMLPKPGRDKYQACNYRPISLLSCLGKMLERYIYRYLLDELNSKNFFNDNQAGFRKKRTTAEHLFRLAQQTSNGFKKRKCTLALFLDVRAAFDSVWKAGLKYKINKIGLSKQMRNLLFSFLDERTLRVNVNGIWSEVVTLEAGTPQGSCLSPILYIIFVNDVTDALDLNKLSASQFADDIGLWCTHSDLRTAQLIIQDAIKRLETWCQKWYVSLHPAKSKLLLLSKCFRHWTEVEDKGLSVTLFDETVSVVNEAKFLGVTFDSRLTYEPQTRKTLAKAYKRLNLLRMISSMSTKNKPEMLLKLYESIIRPIFEYSSICSKTTAECHTEKLQLLQNQALRSVLKTPAYVSVKDLHDLAGISQIKDHLTYFARKQLENIKTRSPIVNATLLEYEAVKHIRENASILDVLGSNG